MSALPFLYHMDVKDDFSSRHFNYEFTKEVILARQGYLATELRSISNVADVIIATPNLFRIRHDGDAWVHLAVITAIGRHAQLSPTDFELVGVRIFPYQQFISLAAFREEVVPRR